MGQGLWEAVLWTVSVLSFAVGATVGGFVGKGFAGVSGNLADTEGQLLWD